MTHDELQHLDAELAAGRISTDEYRVRRDAVLARARPSAVGSRAGTASASIAVDPDQSSGRASELPQNPYSTEFTPAALSWSESARPPFRSKTTAPAESLPGKQSGKDAPQGSAPQEQASAEQVSHGDAAQGQPANSQVGPEVSGQESSAQSFSAHAVSPQGLGEQDPGGEAGPDGDGPDVTQIVRTFKVGEPQAAETPQPADADSEPTRIQQNPLLAQAPAASAAASAALNPASAGSAADASAAEAPAEKTEITNLAETTQQTDVVAVPAMAETRSAPDVTDTHSHPVVVPPGEAPPQSDPEVTDKHDISQISTDADRTTRPHVVPVGDPESTQVVQVPPSGGPQPVFGPQQGWAAADSTGTPWGDSDLPPLPDTDPQWMRQGAEVFDDARGSNAGKIAGVGVAILAAVSVLVLLVVFLNSPSAPDAGSAQPAPGPPPVTLPQAPPAKPVPPVAGEVLTPRLSGTPHPFNGPLDRAALQGQRSGLLPASMREAALTAGMTEGFFLGTEGAAKTSLIALRMPDQNQAAAVAGRYAAEQQGLNPDPSLSYSGVRTMTTGNGTYRTAYVSHYWAIIVDVSAPAEQSEQARQIFKSTLDSQVIHTPPTVRQ